MKFKEQIDNRYIFNGGYDSEELELAKSKMITDQYSFKNIVIRPDFSIAINGSAKYKDIQTAVNLMQILKDEGLV